MGALDVNTRAILKKVALNPSVFWGFQYVTSQFDGETGRVLFGGDIGDSLSWYDACMGSNPPDI